VKFLYLLITSPIETLPRNAKLALLPAMIAVILLLLLALESIPHQPFIYTRF
jgi:hypothetical protein